MKLTHNALKSLIFEEIRKASSVLLEMPSLEGSYGYRGEDNGDNGDNLVDLSAQKLHKIGRQADTLHDIVAGAANIDALSNETKKTIEELESKMQEIFDAVEYEKNHPKGR